MRARRIRRPWHPRFLTCMWMACLAPGGCARESVHVDTFFAMSSYVEVRAVTASEASAHRAFQAVRAEVDRLDAVLSDFRPDSNVNQLNARQTDRPAPETLRLLEYAQRVCRETGGAFDVSLGPVKHLWGFGGTPRVPEPAELDSLIRHVGCDVYALRDGRMIWLDAQARIDLGGIAQGLVAERAGEVLRAHGITSYLVDISGDIVAAGRHPSGRDWQVGIQHPRAPDSLLATVALRGQSVTTAGDYETAFFTPDGRRYHHIFDPATGWPVRGVASVSVFAADPVAADCYDTALFVMGPERGLRFAEEHPGLEAFIVADAADSLAARWTSGLQGGLDVHATLAPGQAFVNTKNPSASSP